MSHPLLRFEPLIWLLFGLGIMLGSMLLTGWCLIVGIAAPLGFVPADALSYERAYALAAHPVGRLVLAAVVILPLWKGVHHMRHFSIDTGHADADGVVGSLCYLLAIVGSVLGILAVVRL